MLAFFLYFKGKEAPNIKNLQGQGSLGGGALKRGVSTQILYVYAHFWFLKVAGGLQLKT